MISKTDWNAIGSIAPTRMRWKNSQVKVQVELTYSSSDFLQKSCRRAVCVPVIKNMRYKTNTEILNIVGIFENCTISRDEWKHAEHLTVAMHYALNHDYTTAYDKMKSGIFKLLNSFGVDLNVEMPYHETLTVFWLKTVFDYVKANRNKTLVEMANEIIEKFDKDYPLNFYSREHLFSAEARKTFIPADLQK
jgi:hypothetical protein